MTTMMKSKAKRVTKELNLKAEIDSARSQLVTH